MDGNDEPFDAESCKKNNMLKIVEVSPGIIYRVQEISTDKFGLASVVFPVKAANLRNLFLEELDSCLRLGRRLLLPETGSRCCAFRYGKWSRVIIKRLISDLMVLTKSIDYGWCEFMKISSFVETPPFFDQFEPMAIHIRFNDGSTSYEHTRKANEYLVRFLEWNPETEHWVVEFKGIPVDINHDSPSALQGASSIPECRKLDYDPPESLVNCLDFLSPSSQSSAQDATTFREETEFGHNKRELTFTGLNHTPHTGYAETPLTSRAQSSASEAAKDENVVQELASAVEKTTLSESVISEVPNMNLTGSSSPQPIRQIPYNPAARKKHKAKKQRKQRRQVIDVIDVLGRSRDLQLNYTHSNAGEAYRSQPYGVNIRNEGIHGGPGEANRFFADRNASAMHNLNQYQDQTALSRAHPLSPSALLDRANWRIVHSGPNHVVLNVLFHLHPPVPFNMCGYIESISEADVFHAFYGTLLPAVVNLMRLLLSVGGEPGLRYTKFQSDPTVQGPCLAPMSGYVWNLYPQNETMVPAMSQQQSTTVRENNGGVQNGAAHINPSLESTSIPQSLGFVSGNLPNREDRPRILEHTTQRNIFNQQSSQTGTSPFFNNSWFLPTEKPQSNQMFSNREHPVFVTTNNYQDHGFSQPPPYPIPGQSNRMLNSNIQSWMTQNNQGQPSFQQQFPPYAWHFPPLNNEQHHHLPRGPPFPYSYATAVSKGRRNQPDTTPSMLREPMRNDHPTNPPPLHHGSSPADRTFSVLTSFLNPSPSSCYQLFPAAVPEPNEVTSHHQGINTTEGRNPIPSNATEPVERDSSAPNPNHKQ